MPERRKQDEPLYRRPKTARERITEKLGPAFEVGELISSAPAGGTITGFKIASKLKKVYDNATKPNPPRKPTIADQLMNGSPSVATVKAQEPQQPQQSQESQPIQPELTQMEKQQRRRQYRGY